MRRGFTVALQAAIIIRATQDGRIHCERCGVWVRKRKDWQIDHILPEGMRPAADLMAKLKPADGQLLCIACHAAKTRRDVGDIAEAKRREAAALGVMRPGKRKIWWRPGKDEKPPLRTAAGVQGIWRRISR